MSADLHIHILDLDLTTEEEVNYFNAPIHSASDKRWTTAYEHIAETPNIWIGEVSWLKAALLDDSETFIPDAVGKIQEIVGTSPVELTEDMLANILTAFDLPNTTQYDVRRKDDVETFLRPYIGQKIFTVSW